MLEAAATEAGVGYEVRSIDRRIAGPMDAGSSRSPSARAPAGPSSPVISIRSEAMTRSAWPPSALRRAGLPSVGGVIHHPTELTTPGGSGLRHSDPRRHADGTGDRGPVRPPTPRGGRLRMLADARLSPERLAERALAGMAPLIGGRPRIDPAPGGAASHPIRVWNPWASSSRPKEPPSPPSS